MRNLSASKTRGLTPHESQRVSTSMTILSRLRISSEWGVGNIQNVFRVLKLPLPTGDITFGKIVWEVALRLFNVRVRLMGIGQIKKVFENQSNFI